MNGAKYRKGEFISSLTYYQQVFAALCMLGIVLFRYGLCVESTLIDDRRGEDQSLETLFVTNHITEPCLAKCPDENRTNLEHLNAGCGKDCYMRQCTLGCQLWEFALESSCQIICNKTDDENLDPKELYCVMGCNDAQSRYFKWLRSEVGTPAAPALVADSLTATSLSLEWEIPAKLIELTKGKPFIPKSYLVQWRYEEVDGDWKFCRNQSMGDNSTVRVDNLQPYTKYRFRVALPLSPKDDEVLVSEQSVIISTLAMGVPLSEPAIDIPASDNTKFYMFPKLLPSKNYSILVSMRNAEGEGPAAEAILTTPIQPPVKDDEPEPTLILAAEYSVLSQGSDILSQPQNMFYQSKDRILGIAIHIEKQLIFVSDEAGYVFRVPLERAGNKEAILSPKSDQNFKPMSLSLDWLNEHIYILGEVLHPNAQRFYQISRCDLEGRGLTTAIAGLHKRPNYIQVDPINGYLFWVVTGHQPDTGLFRLDLRDISNGVKHDVKPLHLIQGGNLGAFVVEYTKFRILVPPQDNNTVISVSLDGIEREDIRNNTQSPKLNVVKSLAMANGIFYWTNGSDLFMEDHHNEEDIYYHNAYPGLPNETFVAVCVNLPSVQPIPVPVNPPRHVQALLTANKAKISWRIPHLLGNQGKGAWQEWNYVLEIINDNTRAIRNIKGTYFTVENLDPNTNYTFRAAAYTAAGKGPWSTEFYAKTLKSSHDRYLIWSSSDGLLESDVLGEHIHSLIPKAKLGDHEITDMAWYDDVLFFVSNSMLRYYNRTSGLLARFRDLDSVESIGVDWIGKRIYWSNPRLQLIARATFNGNEQETVPTIAVARELKIDSLNGHIYYSTGHAVEVCQLNGKNKRVYYSVAIYSGKLVMGLTLDMDNQRVFWIVRSYERSSLFNAPMAKDFTKDSIPIETTLEERSLNGPLTHFSDRLLWLQDNHTVIIGDLAGKNLARIRSSKLSGLRSVSVIDPTHHVYPNISQKLNVIPEQIDNTSIQISGNWTAFDISWNPVRTVTYGDIFYELMIHSEDGTDIKKELTGLTAYHYTNHRLAPYTPLEITIRAYTYWGSCKNTFVRLHSPAAAPSVPTRTRVFVTHHHYPLDSGLNISATLRWNPPLQPNGPIKGYSYSYCFTANEKQTCGEWNTDKFDKIVGGPWPSDQLETSISPLTRNSTYLFQMRAFTAVGGSNKTNPIHVKVDHENPVPVVLVATPESILELDMDLNVSSVLVHTGSPVKFFAHIRHEKRILWVNENRELISYNGSNGTRSKLLSISGDILSLSIDWVERIVYWSQLEYGDSSTIYQLDLNRNDGFSLSAEKLLTRPSIIKNLIVLPINRTLFWLEFSNMDSKQGKLVKFSSVLASEDDMDVEKSQCLNATFQRILLDTKSIGENKLLLVNSNEKVFHYGLKSESCLLLKVRYDNTTQDIAKDSGHIYLIKNGTIYTYNHKQNLQYALNVTRSYRMLAYYHQSYPSRQCLTPKKKGAKIDYIPELVQKTNQSFLLQFPELESECSDIKLAGIKYVITYSDLESVDLMECKAPACKILVSYDPRTEIGNLKPYTRYYVQLRVNNYYGEQMGMPSMYGQIVILSTTAGSPSPPRNITAEPISPTEAIVQWLPPIQFNSDSVTYEVHWRTENPVTGVRNRQQRIVTSEESMASNTTNLIAINLTKLLPSQTYSIWIQAYSTAETYNSSAVVQIDTFSEPENITVIDVHPYSFNLKWKTHRNITRYILEFAKAGSSNYETIVDSESDERVESEKENFIINELQPKTSYKFFLRLFYAKRNVPYIWPNDNRFTFETLGDRPSAPGKPEFRQVSGDVFKVSWEPSKENGATIEEYSLEALLSHISNKIEHKDYEISAAPLVQTPTNRNYTPSELRSDIAYAEQREPIEEKWKVYYNGTDAYWIVKDLQPKFYSFRVRAKNLYGWGPYSSMSEPINEPYVSPERRDTLLVAIFAPVMIVMSCVMLAICIIFILQRRSVNKKVYGGNSQLPIDVELANLRELPRGGNFIHTTNILYTPGPITDADVALLPQIRRDQINMSNFLGSGAFGEVYEGCVRNVGDVPETRVAIKTLRKGATEQEKGEFLQEAQLMSNFKHEHILRLIGVCFDSDTLYIIMELMQGGDLLSYLRQSRPTAGIPSSLTLFDLVSMCVDVASGCRYLEEMHFVHRDLACRNCLVSSVDPEYRVVKIGDFGLARDIYKNDYYRKEGEGLLPVRWMSPESLVDGVFTSQSDIWAFGVLCWEIMTLGQQPYPARNNVEVLHYVRDGGRLGRPADCPDDLYQLMLKCWSYSPEERPTFRYCLEVLQCLKDHTSENIKIMVSNSNRIVNGTLKFINQDHVEPPIIVTPTSSTTSMIIDQPKYLELLCEENEDAQPISYISDGYETPFSSDQTGTAEKERTFSNSSTVSRSSSPNLVNSLGHYKSMNPILTVVLPPSDDDNNIKNSSNKSSTLGKDDKHLLGNGMKPFYSNTQIDSRQEDDSKTAM